MKTLSVTFRVCGFIQDMISNRFSPLNQFAVFVGSVTSEKALCTQSRYKLPGMLCSYTPPRPPPHSAVIDGQRLSYLEEFVLTRRDLGAIKWWMEGRLNLPCPAEKREMRSFTLFVFKSRRSGPCAISHGHKTSLYSSEPLASGWCNSWCNCSQRRMVSKKTKEGFMQSVEIYIAEMCVVSIVQVLHPLALSSETPPSKMSRWFVLSRKSEFQKCSFLKTRRRNVIFFFF